MPIIEVVIFRGTGGLYNADSPYYDEPPLIRAGHVGIIGIINEQIIGFHPTLEATEELGGEQQLLKALKEGIPQPARLYDDTGYFERASDLAETTNNTHYCIYLRDGNFRRNFG